MCLYMMMNEMMVTKLSVMTAQCGENSGDFYFPCTFLWYPIKKNYSIEYMLFT